MTLPTLKSLTEARKHAVDATVADLDSDGLYEFLIHHEVPIRVCTFIRDEG